VARQQVQYDGRAEALQTVFAPKVSAVQARLDPGGSTGLQLAEALGAAGPSIQQFQKKMEDEQKQKAQEFASSVTVEELNRRVKDRTLLPSQSPVFVATVQNIAGQNKLAAIERDTLSKMETGELSFGTREELDEYLVGKRNEALAGASQFTTAGFDASFNQFRGKMFEVNTRLNDKKVVEQGLQVASEKLNNTLVTVTSPDFTGTDADRVSTIMKDYELLTGTSILRDDARKTALDGILARLADSGNTALHATLLDTKLPNNGPTIRAYIGDQRAVTLQSLADRKFEQIQRERAVAVARAADEAATNAAVDQAVALVAAGDGGNVGSVALPSGKSIKSEDLAAAAVGKVVAANPEMSFADQVLIHSRSNVVNEAWKNRLVTATLNINEVNIDANGKTNGTLTESTIQALNDFSVINQISPAYAEKLVGSEKYNMLSDLQFLRDVGFGGDANKAASVINSVRNNRIDPANWGRIQAQVDTTMEKLTNPSIFSARGFSELIRWELGESEKNLLPIRNKVRKLTELLLASGQVNTPDDAEALVSSYLTNPAVTSQINNTLYLNKDLPQVPTEESGNQAKWVKAYMEDVIGARLKAAGYPFKMKDLTLMPLEGGTGVFQVNLRAQGIANPDGRGFYRVTRTEMENWIKSEYEVRKLNIRNAASMTQEERFNAPTDLGDIMAP
jgi:hypothetical protein